MKSVCRGARLAIVKVHEEVNNAATTQQPKTIARFNVHGEKIKKVKWPKCNSFLLQNRSHEGFFFTFNTASSSTISRERLPWSSCSRSPRLQRHMLPPRVQRPARDATVVVSENSSSKRARQEHLLPRVTT